MTCIGCQNLTSKSYGDGTTIYGCKLFPGLVIGGSSALSGDDLPERCEKYEEIRGDEEGK